MEVLIENGKSIYSIYAVMGLAIIVRILEGILYRRLLRQSENMENTNNKYLKRIKQKFESCYKSNLDVNNIEVFVDKYILKIKMCGLSWRKFNNFMIILGMICAGLGFLYGFIAYNMEMQMSIVINYVLRGSICGAVVLLVYYFSDMEYKKNIIKINVREFFENTYINRLKNEKERTVEHEKISGEEKQKLMESIDELKRETEKIENSRKRRNRVKTDESQKDNEKLLNDILQEYFS